MDGVLLDTDVVSYAFREAVEYEPYKRDLYGKTAFISFMTWAELMRGSLSRKWGERRRAELYGFVEEKYVVINSNQDVSRIWGEVVEEAKSKGRVIQTADAWVAATAIAADLPLLSNNRKHYGFLDSLNLVSHAP